MTFLSLNGTTIPCASNTTHQEDEEHGLDRARMFDGTLRMSRRGVFRVWTVTTNLVTEATATSILDLVRSTSILTASGDLVGDDVAVMPIPGTNDPVQTASGFRRRVTFQLKETGGPLPADTTATVFLFLRDDVRQFQDRAGTVAAGTGDDVRYWGDATGNGNAAIGQNDVFSWMPRGTKQSDGGVFCGVSHTGAGAAFDLPDMHLLPSAAVLAKLKTSVSPTDTHLWLMNRDAHQSENTRYPDLGDGHIWDSFGTQNATDFGLPPEDLSGYNVYEVVQTTTERTARLNGVQLYTSAGPFTGVTGIYFTSSPGARLSGSLNTEYFDGTIRRLVVIVSPTPSQIRSWRDYMMGIVSDPPLP